MATALLPLTGCATLAPFPRPASAVAVRQWHVPVSLHGSTLDLHLARPETAAQPTVLVLYASGDGGWFGAAVGMFDAIAASGYPAVGFSSRAFLKVDRRQPGASLDPRQLAQDYAVILRAARTELGLPPETPALLTGWSRGAAFAVLAAATSSDPNAAGVIAIGLAAGEDLRIDGPDDESDEGTSGSSPSTPSPFSPYDTLVHQLHVRRVVIQSTGDQYLPAAKARPLFGPDTSDRRLLIVPARNHRFSGGEPAFVQTLVDALRWIAGDSIAASRHENPF